MKGRRPLASMARVSGLRVAGAAAGELEHRGVPQHAGIEEFEQAPQFAEVIFDRRAAQGQPMVGLQKPHGLGRFGARRS